MFIHSLYEWMGRDVVTTMDGELPHVRVVRETRVGEVLCDGDGVFASLFRITTFYFSKKRSC